MATAVFMEAFEDKHDKALKGLHRHCRRYLFLTHGKKSLFLNRCRCSFGGIDIVVFHGGCNSCFNDLISVDTGWRCHGGLSLRVVDGCWWSSMVCSKEKTKLRTGFCSMLCNHAQCALPCCECTQSRKKHHQKNTPKTRTKKKFLSANARFFCAFFGFSRMEGQKKHAKKYGWQNGSKWNTLRHQTLLCDMLKIEHNMNQGDIKARLYRCDALCFMLWTWIPLAPTMVLAMGLTPETTTNQPGGTKCNTVM